MTYYSQMEENVYGHKKRFDFFLQAIEAYRKGLNKKKNEIKILDVGCGSGEWITFPLAEQGYSVEGIDIDPASIEYAKQMMFQKENINFKVFPPYVFPQEKFDIIICSEVLEHVHEPSRLLRGLAACVFPQGKIIITTPNGYGGFEIEKFLYNALQLNKIWKIAASVYKVSGLMWIWHKLRGEKNESYIPANFVPNTLREHDDHVQHFTTRSLKHAIYAAGLSITNWTGSTLWAGPISHFLCKKNTFFKRLNVKLATILPHFMTSGWYLELKTSSFIRHVPNKFLLFFPYFDVEAFFEKHQQNDWEIASAADFAQKGVKGMLRALLKLKFDSFYIGRPELNTHQLKFYLQTIMLIARATDKAFIDNKNTVRKVNLFRYFFVATPLIILEILFDFLIVVTSYLWIVLLWIIYKLIPRKFTRNKDNKTVAFLRTDNFGKATTGGSFTHAAGFKQGVLSSGYKIMFLGAAPPVPSDAESPFFAIPYTKEMNSPEIPEILYGWKFSFVALRILRKKKVSFLYHRHSAFNCSVPLVARLLGVPLVLEYNGSEAWVKEKWGRLFLKNLCRAFEKVALFGADHISVVSDVLKEELLHKGIPAKNIILNPNGVDCLMFNPDTNGEAIKNEYKLHGKIVVGFIGSFGPWHGVDVLVKAIKPALDLNPKLHFLIIGDGALRGYIEKNIREQNVVEHVTMTGMIPHESSPQYLAACDILASPHVPNCDGSRFFGSPTKLFEYMAMGRAIVASDLEQIGSILKHKKTALLVKPGSVTELVAGIIELSKDAALRARLGQEARKLVEHAYSWQHNAQRVINAVTVAPGHQL